MTIPQLLIPSQIQYGKLDVIANRLVNEIIKREYKIPGLNIEMSTYGGGTEYYTRVNYITDPEGNFKLHFAREVGRGGNYNKVCALSDITIPMKKLSVCSDFSGSYYMGIGDWEEIRESFMAYPRYNEKLLKLKQTHVRFRPANTPSGRTFYIGRLNEYFVADDDAGRAYTDGAPERVLVQDVLETFASFVEVEILARVLAVPINEKIIAE